ncbi:MAG: glycosyltransferase, partial [Coriobacteriia bacterium]|nr:glycosyltransferase [Coriobacteriia bacterium]
EIARQMGASVLENTTPPGGDKGKPFAIKAAFDDLGDQLTEYYDAIAVFDADNLVDANYLQVMNDQLLNGERVIQCYLDSKNPTDNHITLGYAATYFYMNRSWQLAKYRLGLHNAIGGTGFCIDTEVIKEIGWTAKSLVEDLEFTMQCALNNIQVTWCHTTHVYDEKPENFKASCVQRLRWARGHWDVFFRYAPKLLRRAITQLDFRAFDSVLYLLMPAFMIAQALMWIIFFIGVFVMGQGIFVLFPLWLWIPFWIVLRFYVLYVCSVDSSIKYSKVRAILAIMLLNLSYIPLACWGVLTCKNKSWVCTEHTKGVSYAHASTGEQQVGIVGH